MKIIPQEDDSVIYMGVHYSKEQWEEKLKEINLKKYE
jgi:hypothetical protein